MINDNDKQIRILQKLHNEIELHNHLYYKENNPKISDFEYDCLKAELERLEHNLQIPENDSLSQKIGDDRSSDFEKAEHLSQMFSLSNTYSKEELIDYDTRSHKLANDKFFDYIVEPKIDGIAINLIYINGKFTQAITRGNGIIGDDVTQNILTIKNLPQTIDQTIFTNKVEIRGEVYLDEKTFIDENVKRKHRGLPLYANPRNLVAGTIKCLKIDDVRKRNLKLIVYAIGYAEKANFHTQHEVLLALTKAGFQSQENFYTAKDIHEALLKIEQIDVERKNLPYWTDGAVIKINQLDLHENFGETSKSPRWSVAYKFSPDTAETKVNNIVLQVGRTGIITPIAELEPVEISGSTVSHSTLYNAEDLQRKDIRINDYVIIEKAGEIIPAIISVNLDKRTNDSKIFIFPEFCPSCCTKLIKINNNIAWRCPNENCPDQIKTKIEYFCSSEAMDIMNLGQVIIGQLVDSKIISNIADVYDITFDELVKNAKLATKSAMNILRSINRSKQQPIWRLINGLSINGIGTQTAKDLAKHFNSVEKLYLASSVELMRIDGIGSKLSETINAFFKNENNKRIIERLRNSGLNFSTKIVPSANNKLKNKTFVITGTFEGIARENITNIIETNGGVVKNTISSKTDFLIAGKNSGSKLQKTKNFNTQIIDITTLNTLLS